MGIAEGLKRGTIEIILLSLLSQKDMYGYDICREIEEKSNGLYVVTEGSLYPVLYRMLEKGYITDRSEKVGKRRTRVYYHIEQSGIDYLEEIKNEYFSLHNGIKLILDSSAEDSEQ
ncbi:MAG: PadR family transcriptional regulator [Clostridia bacterium]|nr:PadR family transcriptional regulator [Clostridia bacterium]